MENDPQNIPPKKDFVKLDVDDSGSNSNSHGSDDENNQEQNTNPSSVVSFEIEQTVIDNPAWLGNCRAFCYKGLNPLFTIGPHWPFFIGMNTFVISLSILFLCFVISKVTRIGTILGAILLILQVLLYFTTFILNPGIPDRNLLKPGAAKAKDKKYFSLTMSI